MAAEQAAELSDRNIIVIGTKTIPQGITALLSFDDSMEPTDAAEAMRQAVGSVKTAQVTYAARDSEFDGKEIHEGQLLGLIEGKVSFVDDSMDSLVKSIFEQMLSDGGEFINVYYGENVTPEEASAIGQLIESMAPEAEVIVLPGDQPVYHYIFSVE